MPAGAAEIVQPAEVLSESKRADDVTGIFGGFEQNIPPACVSILKRAAERGRSEGLEDDEGFTCLFTDAEMDWLAVDPKFAEMFPEMALELRKQRSQIKDSG